jgi:secondary thiamine-phosphate synthase enzyme
MHTLTLSTSRREQMLDITAELQALVSAGNIREGLLQVHCPHTTAGLTVNENADPDVVRDMLVTLARLIPERGDYRHGEGNSDAHLKSSCMGCGLSLIVSEGRIRLGTWQGVYFCEFDGPRTRQVWVQLMGSSA